MRSEKRPSRRLPIRRTFSFLRAAHSGFRRKNLFVRAAAIAFYAFLSLFPVILILIYLSSLFLRDALTVDNIQHSLRLFPAVVTELVKNNIDSVLASGGVFSIVSLIFILILGFKVFREMERALFTIFEAETGLVARKRLGRTFVFFLLTVTALLLLSLGGGALLFTASRLDRIPLVTSWLILLVTDAALATLFFSWSYTYFSPTRLPFRKAVKGGLFAALLWSVLKNVFGIYVARLDRYSVVYGSIGTVVLLLLWLYYSILLYLFGAEISGGMQTRGKS